MSSKRTRGANKKTPWSRKPGEGCVLRLALDTSDPLPRAHLESLFSTAFVLRRALQRRASSALTAFWAAHKERQRAGRPAVLERLHLSQRDLEYAAYDHLNEAPHLRRYLTKTLAMHLADSVWHPVERHLFPDSTGKRFGRPRLTRWFDFARIPGRARLHSAERKWETFRLHGSLAGHRREYIGADGSFFQPRRMRSITTPKSWWSYDGPLAVVLTGLVAGEVVVPVRLPAAPSNQPILDYFLGDPSSWHKIDLVRRRDPNAAGGWRYEAHLMVLKPAYASPATRERRARAAQETAGRGAGIDVNVSNITVASHTGGEDLRITRIERDGGEKVAAKKRRRKTRRRNRRLERSRRATNPDQYHLSTRQQVRAAARTARGLPPQQVIPAGPRKAHAGGRPLQAFRKDTLSKRYRRERASAAAEAASAAQAARDRARRIAARITLEHGFMFVVESGLLSAWAKLWGRALHAFSPGTLLAAVRSEATAVAACAGATAGGIRRASTVTTAMSQHCLCGERVAKTLSERIHHCSRCGLVGDRDAVSAVLASFVSFGETADPSSAKVNYDASRASLATPATRRALAATVPNGRQDARSESNAHTAILDSFADETERSPIEVDAVARRIVGTAMCPTPDETGSGRTTPERAHSRTDLSHNGGLRSPPLRDSS